MRHVRVWILNGVLVLPYHAWAGYSAVAGTARHGHNPTATGPASQMLSQVGSRLPRSSTTRSVRRASGLLETALSETGQPRSRLAGHFPLTTFGEELIPQRKEAAMIN